MAPALAWLRIVREYNFKENVSDVISIMHLFVVNASRLFLNLLLNQSTKCKSAKSSARRQEDASRAQTGTSTTAYDNDHTPHRIIKFKPI